MLEMGMAQSKQIKKLRPKHEAIMDWLIMNPDSTQGECAAAFGVTEGWLSVIVNSDVFQEVFRQKNEEVFQATVLTLRDRMNGLAHRAYEKLSRQVDYINDPNQLLTIADKTAHRLGYAPTKGPDPAGQPLAVQQNFFMVDPTSLKEARETMHTIREKNAEGETIDSTALPAPKEL